MVETFANSINVWLIWILPFAGAAIIPAIAKGSKKARDYIAVGFALASAISAATLIPIGLAGHEVHSQVTWISALGLKAGVLADPLAIVMTNVVAWIAFLIFVYSLGYMHGDRDLTRYWFFMLFFIGSMQLIVISDNLLMVFFGWEGVGLASYALIGFWYHDRKKDYVGKEGHMAGGIPMWTAPTHAGMKAFLMTKAGDVMMLAGMFLIFAYAGTFGFKELVADQSWAAAMSQQNLLVPAAVLLFGGAVGKSAQFPLNEWLLEAMTGPTSVSALIHAATMVKAGVFLVARLGPLFFALSALNTSQFFEVVAWTGAITAFLLATQALVSPEIKKVLAYSTGSQIGYMMMALGIAGISLNFTDGYTAGFFHLMSHAMFKASLFMGAGALLHSVGSRFMTDMGGLRKDMRKTYIFMMLAALSLAGAPLFTSGFWSKDAIFAAILESGYTYSWPLFAMAVIVAVMTAFYTMRMIGMSFFGNKSKHLEEMEHKGHHVHEVGPVMWVPFAILAVATIAVGVVGFVFEEQLHELFSEYLGESFGIAPAHEATGRTFLNLNPIAAIASVGAFAVGAGLGFVFYIARKADPEAIGRNIITRGIWKFLYNRWYLNTALYWGGVIGPLAIYRFIWRYFESTVIDGINPAFQGAMAGMSKVVKSGQTGITQTYLFVFAVGIMIVVMLLLM
ncbi:NADH dehydrogenase subunit L [Candidatus Nitrososphaera evergladensis SR1]|jgi:NADH-quinone oxidoreductase subunit L|uniref:NADH dehydrogenase subunit L n=1 Tax=Candidatus Nitrososphaera evergladensis SR1 TaxID=1459636 RepID=A0A075MVB1_9ARCH|nr:NADH-quinone oxidoreductase subunit L [Candidatus Nitrososphaera evergladensis]AIF84597.1 NADH dehydrogenase subunit L [Candidatus Nitrososphaera evergladensis SR1]